MPNKKTSREPTRKSTRKPRNAVPTVNTKNVQVAKPKTSSRKTMKRLASQTVPKRRKTQQSKNRNQREVHIDQIEAPLVINRNSLEEGVHEEAVNISTAEPTITEEMVHVQPQEPNHGDSRADQAYNTFFNWWTLWSIVIILVIIQENFFYRILG